MHSRTTRALPCALAATAALLATGTVQAQKTYFIGESTDFTGNGCPSNDVATVTESLQTALRADGWTGTRWVNADSWRHDFIEECSASFGAGGVDSQAGDEQLLSVYAGHGGPGFLAWGFPRDNLCTVDLKDNARLGSMSGAKAGYAMFVTSCTLTPSSLVNHANFQWVRQQFGYHNSPWVKGDQPKEFFDATAGTSNTTAWLDKMEDRPYWFTFDNSPVVVSYGAHMTGCMEVHNHAKLKGNDLRSPRGGGPACEGGQPAFWYCYSIRDNGDC
jgi:hypothetical protein